MLVPIADFDMRHGDESESLSLAMHFDSVACYAGADCGF